uniref:Uncharacterized protein n=1 Tax=Ditylenchus dipsaci TaxID=166011 RepID=A0A915D1K8_9BILA
MNALSDPTISPSVCSTSSNIAAPPTQYDLSLSTGRNHLMELDDKSILSQPSLLNMPPNSQDINHSQHSFIGYSNISANETLACNSQATIQMDVSMPTNSMSSHLTQPYIHHSQSIYHEANNSMMSRMDEQQQSNSSLELSTTGPTSNTVKSEMNLAQASPVCATGINPNNLLAMEVNNCIVDRGGMNC